jgi:pyridoxamine 5'-phosphate oxidase
MLRDIRKQYEYAQLNESTVLADPLIQFKTWLNEAIDTNQPEPTAMVVTTVNASSQPHSRVVLLKEISSIGFTFYTNFNSTKGQDIAQNNHISLLFFWHNLERQVRINGTVDKIDEQTATDYFHSRPLDSQLAAWASPQSSVIPSREFLDERFKSYQTQFENNIPKPPHWGGYLVTPHQIEFWQGRPNRLHDRLIFTKENDGWKIERLAP